MACLCLIHYTHIQSQLENKKAWMGYCEPLHPAKVTKLKTCPTFTHFGTLHCEVKASASDRFQIG